MTNEEYNLKPVVELNSISDSLYHGLVSEGNPSVSRLLNYQISLLEIFAYESKKLTKLGYCDSELAYICYEVASALNRHSAKIGNDKSSAFSDAIAETLASKRHAYESICQRLSPKTSSSDPLMSRFNRLTSQERNSSDASADDLPEALTPVQLNNLLQKRKILLIDYRAAKDFKHNHISHPDVINIEPSHIVALTDKDSVTDQDLEARLKLHLPADQFAMFQSRHKYDLVVMYNLKYGYFGTKGITDRMQALKLSLIEDSTLVPSRNPFNRLVDLIMYRNKYISSKLKHHPSFLLGGVFAWHQLFGDAGLKRTTEVLTRPSASLSRSGSSTPTPKTSYGFGASSPSNGYLKNFGEYLSTANSNSETPVSNTFVTTNNYLPTNFTSSTPKYTEVGLPQQAPPPPKRSSSLKKIVPPPKSSASPQPTKDPSKFLEQYTTGLVNLGNSCYMNCVLQCLGATPQLTRFFFPNSVASAEVHSYRQHINVNNTLGTKGILTTNFVGLLANMFNNSGKSFSPGNFKKVVGSLSPENQFSTFDQQDCIEFLNFLLDGLHEDLNQIVVSNPAEKKAILELTPEQEKTRELLPVRLASTIEWERYLKLNFSIIVDYFQGQYLSQLKCLECGLTSTSYNAFSILSLPIPEPLSGSRQVSLDDCLKEFTTTELLDDNNKWHCPQCARFTKSTKKISITRLPQVLIVHFKRFKITPQGYFNKLETFVTYPVEDVLDLTSYWPDVGTSINGNDSITPQKEEQVLSSLPQRNQVPPFRYRLYGVANHFGNLTTGHYTSYVHKASDSKKKRGWCYFDDSKVTYNCSPSQVLNKNAYCLFYQRI